MVNLVICDRNMFIKNTRGKRVFCFGAGKYLQRFLDNQYGIRIDAVVDNWKTGTIELESRQVDIITVEDFKSIYFEDTVVVITCAAIEEVLEQLDSIGLFHGMDCYVDSFMGEVSEQTRLRIENLLHRNKAFLQESKTPFSNGKYQLWESVLDTNMAGSKAPTDIKDILESAGYETVQVHVCGALPDSEENHWKKQRVEQEWKYCYEHILPRSTLVLQHPYRAEQRVRVDTLRRLKADKNIRIISIVHDVEELRGAFQNEYMRSEFNFMLEMADVIVVHNRKMKQYFEDIGVKTDKLVCLEIFDYLAEENQNKDIIFERSINVAGNLDKIKCPYICQLQEIEGLKVHLYGPNYVEEQRDSDVVYHGVLPSGEIPNHLTRGFGLVWDGDSVETCSGMTGNYLRYNNPHKLSLYLASGLPVFIWKEAAEAEYVRENGVGIAVESIHEIKAILDQMTECEYQKYVESVSRVSQRIRNGFHTKEAVEKAERLLG